LSNGDGLVDQLTGSVGLSRDEMRASKPNEIKDTVSDLRGVALFKCALNVAHRLLCLCGVMAGQIPVSSTDYTRKLSRIEIMHRTRFVIMIAVS
jgi:hypothetical protein